MRFNASTDYRGAAWLHAGLLFTFMFLFAPSESQAQVVTRPVRPLRVAYLSTSATMAPVWMAKDSGGFAREALDTEVLSMSSSSAIPALIVGRVIRQRPCIHGFAGLTSGFVHAEGESDGLADRLTALFGLLMSE